MNKKLLITLLVGVMSLVLVNAGIMAYFGQIKSTVDVEQPISFFVNEVEESTGEQVSETVPCEAGETCMGSNAYKVANDGESDRIVSLITSGNTNGVDVSYVGKLELTKKNTGTWQPVSPEDTIEVLYTVVGDSFEAIGDLPNGYVLVYAMDKENRFNDYATVIRVEDVDESLPMIGDWNANADPDYCESHNTFDSYAHCVGAKIWAVPESAIGVLSGDGISYKLTWSDMGNYYWETDLIYYFANNEGEITVPAGSFIEFYPQFSVDSMATEGDYVIYTTVNPVA